MCALVTGVQTCALPIWQVEHAGPVGRPACGVGLRARSGQRAVLLRGGVLLPARGAQSLHGPVRRGSFDRREDLLAIDLGIAIAILPGRDDRWRRCPRPAAEVEVAGSGRLPGPGGPV